VETARLAAEKPLASMRGATHFVEHILLNPAGDCFIFFHRWHTAEGSTATRLYRMRLPDGDACLLPDSGFYSHANWLNDDAFVVWGRRAEGYARLRHSASFSGRLLAPALQLYRRLDRQPVVDRLKRRVARDSFLLFSEGRPPEPFGQAALTEDGHPSTSPADNRYWLVDTYEDALDYRKLLVYDRQIGRCLELGRFHSPAPFNRTEYRCDLHPRWSPSGCLVCVDTLVGGRRQMAVLDVSEALSSL
jgi:hypothetical protein